MMDSPKPIIEFLSGEYHLNEELLSSISSAANECQNVAIISIVGSDIPHNQFFYDCITNYLDSHDKSVWPDNCQSLERKWCSGDLKKSATLRMWSKPFILKVDDQSTAVFLIDFEGQNALSEDIIDLFCGLSSTLIYLKAEQLVKEEFESFKSAVKNRIITSSSFEELMFLVFNWDSNRQQFEDKNYLFGFKGGDRYLKEEFGESSAQIKCYLMPSIGVDIRDEDLSFKQINADFINHLCQLIKRQLLNIDEMLVKNGDNSCLKPQELISLFKESINQLNQTLLRSSEEDIHKQTEEQIQRQTIDISTNQREGSISNRSSFEDITDKDIYSSSDEDQGHTFIKESGVTNEGQTQREPIDISLNPNEKPISSLSSNELKRVCVLDLSCLTSDEMSLIEDQEQLEVGNESDIINKSQGEEKDPSQQNSNSSEFEEQEQSRLYSSCVSITDRTKFNDFSINIDDDVHFGVPTQPSSLMFQENSESKEVIGSDHDHLEDQASASPEPRKKSFEEYQTAFANEDKEQLDLIEGVKNLHLTDSNGFTSGTNETNLATNEESININLQLFEEKFNKDVKFKTSRESNLTSSYQNVEKVCKQRPEQLIVEEKNRLLAMFSTLMNTKIRNQEVRTTIELEKLFQETEEEVHKELYDTIGEIDQSIEIFNQLTNGLDSLKNDFKGEFEQKWNNLMKEFINESTKEFKNKMEKISSIYEINLLKNFHLSQVLKQFDLNFNISDGFAPNYEDVKSELSLQLNNITENVYKDLEFIEKFEKYLKESVPEYDKSMQTFIETELLEQKSDILKFRITTNDLAGYHINSKQSIITLLLNNNDVSEENIHKFSNKIQDLFNKVLSEKMNIYFNVGVCVNNYLMEWEKELIENDYIEKIDEKNQIIIQRRKLLTSTQEVKDYSVRLFEKIYPDIKRMNEEKVVELKGKYDTLFTQTMERFEDQMRRNILLRIGISSYAMDLSGAHDSKSTEAQAYFRIEVKKFDNTGRFLDEFKNKLTKQLTTKKGKYVTALNQINQYRENWVNQLNESRYLSEESMQEVNETLKKLIISSGDEALDEIVNQSLDKIFETFVENIKEIEKRETTIEQKTREYITERFQMIFDNKLRSDLFNQIQVNAMFDKLLKHTEEVFKKRCDFNEYQKELENKGLTELNEKLRQYLRKVFAQHSQNSVNCKNTLKQSVISSIQSYDTQIQKKISSGVPVKRRDFQTLSQMAKEKSLIQHESNLAHIKEYFNSDFYTKLLNDSQNEINQKIETNENVFLKSVENNAEKETSIGIFFDRHLIYSIKFEDLLIKALDKALYVKPNCIAIDHKIMVASEAQIYYQKSTKPMYEEFDIKTLLRNNSLKPEERYLSPFELTDESKIRLRGDGITCELSVEALMATQVIDIKTQVEEEINAVVSSAVFTVPTHFTIRQKNAMKDMANIAGIDKVEIISITTAAALSYVYEAEEAGRLYPCVVLLIAMNDNKCDATVCQISRNQIKYESHFQKEFNIREITDIKRSRSKYSWPYYYSIKGYFKFLNDNIANRINSLKNIVIVGSSDLIQDLVFFIKQSRKFKNNFIYYSDPIQIVIKGTAIYGDKTLRQRYDITELSIYPLGFVVRGKGFGSSVINLTKQNTSLPTNVVYKVKNPEIASIYPICVDIHKNINNNFEKLDCFEIEPLGEGFLHKQFNANPDSIHQISVGVKANGDVFVKSVITCSDSKRSIDLNVRRVRLELSAQQMTNEKLSLQTLLQTTPSNIDTPSEPDSAPMDTTPSPDTKVDTQLDIERQQLKSHFSTVEERLKKCENMSSLLKETFEKHLSDIWSIIDSQESNRNKLKTQKSYLDNIMNKTEKYFK